jgi:C4-dicarboxylate transporter DctM subunit
MPIIILGGIYGGVFTPTEAAVVTIPYGIFVGAFIYRELKPHMFREILVESIIGAAAVMVIIDFSSVLSAFLTAERIPQMVTEGFLAMTDNKFVIINIIMLIIGTFMDASPAIVILTPIFLPLVKTLGYDPIHFGTIMCTNLLIGLVTPPVGVTLFMGSRVAKVKVDEVVSEVWLLIGAMILVLICVNMFPGLSLVLVR